MKANQPNAAQLEAHQCHKDRLKRIASAAVKAPVEVVAPIEVEAPVEAVKPPEPKWEDRQKEIWFSIVEDKSIKPPSVERIIAACAKHFGRSRLDLLCARRTQDVAVPRQIAMYLAKNMTMKSLPEIGRRFSNRDHTTVLHSVRKIARLIHSDSDLAFDVAHIELSLEAA